MNTMNYNELTTSYTSKRLENSIKKIGDSILTLGIGTLSLPLAGAYIAKKKGIKQVMKNTVIGTLLTITLKSGILISPQISMQHCNIKTPENYITISEKLEYENGTPKGLKLETGLDIALFGLTNIGIKEGIMQPPKEKKTNTVVYDNKNNQQTKYTIDEWILTNNNPRIYKKMRKMHPQSSKLYTGFLQ